MKEYYCYLQYRISNHFYYYLNKKFMYENPNDYEFCIKVALENAKKRINLLDSSDKKCVLEEYKEWIQDGSGSQNVFLLRDDPII